MKLNDEMPTHVLAVYKAKGESKVLEGMLTSYRNPTMNLSSYKRLSGIIVNLQNNSHMLSFILHQPLYHEIHKCTSIENQGVTLSRVLIKTPNFQP